MKDDSEIFLRWFVAKAPLPIFVLNGGGRCLMLNGAAADLIGDAPEELVEKRFLEFLDEAPPGGTWFESLRSAGAGTECRLKRRAGPPLWVLLSASEAAPDRYLVLCRDISARKLNEEALRLSEERFRLAMQGANDGLWDWDLGTDHVYYSPRWKSMLGYGESEIEPHLDTWRRLAHPDDVGPVLERVRELVEGRSDKYELGFRMLHKDGQYRHILSRAFLMRDASGKGIRLIGTHVDVTERKLAEERIQNLNMLYATLSGVNAAVVHSSNRKELCEHFCRVGSEVGEWAAVWIGFVDRASSRIVPEAWSASMDDHIGRMSVSVDPSVPEGRGPTGTTARTGEPYFCNDVFADSRTLPWRPFLTLFGMQSAAAVPLRRGAEFIGVINIYSRLKNFFTPEVQALLGDLTIDFSFALEGIEREQHRRRTEKALAESEARYRGLVEQHITGIYLIQGGKFVYVNPRFAAIFGYEPGEIAGMDVERLVAEPDRKLMQENVRKRLSGEVKSVEYTFRGRRKDGSIIDVGVHGSIASLDGQPAIIGVLADISERKRSEERAKAYVAALEKAVSGTVSAVSTMVEVRDPYTAGHESRVADLAGAIAVELGLPDEQVKGMRVIAQVHDIGKISCPAEILSKPGKLTPVELELVKAHAEQGYEILKAVDFPWPVAQAILQHHERADGSGYPKGLKGAEIMLEARILAVADTVEAMSSHRPYRAGFPIEAALTEIERGAGKCYDDQVAAACLRLFREKGYRFPT
jgi:PAS domain S-box-containing protein/putative nucleotidyltransferase with HDIG domain